MGSSDSRDSPFHRLRLRNITIPQVSARASMMGPKKEAPNAAHRVAITPCGNGSDALVSSVMLSTLMALNRPSQMELITRRG